MIVGIHQPNFFPYEGILEKIRRSDLFVLLTHAQFSPGNYHNRFQLGERWMTMSVNRGLEPLTQKRYLRPEADWRRIKESSGRDMLRVFDSCISPSLVETNVAVVRQLCRMLGITTSIVIDEPSELQRTERLLQICQAHQATVYLSGPSGRKYLDLTLFEHAGIEVQFHNTDGLHRSAVEVLEAHDHSPR